jgi:DNA-binding Lrp family transcriptional regulator
MVTRDGADRIDRSLLRALVAHPSANALTIAQESGLSRNTVRARLAAFAARHALFGFERRIDPGFLGFPMRAFVMTTVSQRKLEAVGAGLAEVPEVLEVLGVAGGTDLVVQIVARDADDLYRIAGRILAIDGVRRTQTGLVMRQMVPYRTAQLLDAGA